ncbi:MAG: FG-GAP-like repeat-containing protein, partial [Pyrinomonadaceae bacterium]
MPHAPTSRRNAPRLSNAAAALAALLFVVAATTRADADCASPIFSLPQTYGVGAGPASVAAGDFNGDGRQDLAVPNNVSSNVSVLLGDGAGGFGPPANFAVAEHPASVAVADFNKDGKADLAVGHSFGVGQLSVLLGDGTGQFSTTLVLNTGAATNVAVGDFNADTNPDIAAGLSGGSPRVLLGDGVGHFTVKQFSVGSGSRFVVAGNFNGDNIEDLAFSVDNVLDEIVIVPGDASGNFTAGTRVALDQSPRAMIAHDFNGDGRHDLAITVQLSAGPKLEVLPNDGAGHFGAPTNVAVAQEPLGLTAADFNNDGKADIAVGNGSAQILLGDGAGQFTADAHRALTGGGLMLEDDGVLFAGDFNNDGKADLVSPRADVGVRPGVVLVILGRGDGTFDVSRARALGTFNTVLTSLAVADFNADGRSDVTSTFSFSSSVGLLLGDGAGGLNQSVFYDAPGTPGSMATGDFDGDGKADAASANLGTGFGTVTAFYGDGAGLVSRTANTNASAVFLAPANFNGDGRTDLVALNGNGRVTVLLSSGANGFDLAPGSPFELLPGVPSSSASAVAAADFNGDGRDDLATAISSQNRVLIFLNDGAGRMTLSANVTVPVGTDFHELHLAAGDFNRDGRADVVSANGSARNVTVFLGDGAGGLGAGTNFPATEKTFLSSSTVFMAVADFDGDTNPDLAVTNRGSSFGGELVVLLGDGAGGFAAPISQPIGGDPSVLAVGNFDADSKPDLAVIGLATNAVTLLLNVSEPLPCLSVEDVTLTEGDSGTQNAVFNVALSQTSAETVRVNYSLKGLTANAGADYTPVSGRLVFAPGETAKTVAVPVAGDALDEADETFELELASASNAGVADAVGLGTVNDNDPTPTLSVGDITKTEGNFFGGQGSTATFKIQLSAPSGRNVTVRYATASGTAISESDFRNTTFTATIPAGQTSVDVGVTIYTDDTFEPDETFFLDLSEPVNATIADGRAQCTLTNDDAPPTLTAEFGFGQEGDSGQSTVSFTLHLSNPSALPVSVDYATADGTAVAPGDYPAATGTFTFAPEETAKTFTIAVNGDTVDEVDETLLVNFSNPVNMTLPANTQATGFIIDDDGPAVSIGDVSVMEGSSGTTNAVFTVSLSGPSVQDVQVEFATANGTAVFGEDYQRRTNGLVIIPAGSTSGTIIVRVNGDTKVEPDETFTVNLFEPFGGPIAARGLGTIVDDDTFTTEFFVRQHYADFLSREPDASGLAFWVNEIESCGADAVCREVKRVNVSAAFFLSIEFQETGFLAYRTYKAAYGDATSPGVPGTVPVVRLNEFLPDTRRIGEGVVVNVGAWREQLEANKSAYMQEFVARPRFTNAYPAALTPAQFVDALYANAGVTPSSAERQAA